MQPSLNLLLFLVGCGGLAPETGGVDPVGLLSPAADQVLVPEGPFWMGCDEAVDPSCPKDEVPGREVTLSAFTVDRLEVTVGAYEECVDQGACTPRTVDALSDQEPDHPVTGVDWDQAGAFCAWRGQRLPTEAQWEKAARGADGRLYPWGDGEPTCDLAWSRDCGPDLAPVGAHPAGQSPYGVEDLSGNAWEWVQDWYTFGAYQDGPTVDPEGPSAGKMRVLRSASVYSTSRFLRASERNEGDPSMPCAVCGFRCVGELE